MQYLVDHKANRWKKIDILRFICSVFVVYFHTVFPNNIGYAIKDISKTAVPLFFMISGFFFMRSYSKEKEAKKLKHTFNLILIGTVIYLLLWIFAQVIAGRDITIMLGQQFGYKNLCNMLLWNQPLFGEHLWFLFAYWFIILIAPILRYGKIKKFGVFLIFGNLILGSYAPVLFGRSFPIFLSRNWLFTGIPFVCLGMIFFEKMDTLIRRKPTKLILAGIIIAGICSIFEAALLRKECGAPAGDVYISTTFLAGLIFAYALDNKRTDNKVLEVLAAIGRKYTLWIYMIHPFIATLLDEILKIVLGVHLIYSKTVIVYLISLLVAIVLEKTAEKIRSVLNRANANMV